MKYIGIKEKVPGSDFTSLFLKPVFFLAKNLSFFYDQVQRSFQPEACEHQIRRLKLVTALSLLIFPFFTCAQNADSVWIVNNFIKKEQYITMRDGTKLFTSVYLPKDNTEKHPILITRTTYSCYGINSCNRGSHGYGGSR